MSIKSRVKEAPNCGEGMDPAERQERAREAEKQAFRERCIAAGVRPPDKFGNLAPGEWDKYCQFYGLDYDREEHDLPCDSWRFKTHPGSMTPIWYWPANSIAREPRGVSPLGAGTGRPAGTEGPSSSGS